jgi:hypothetical protein
MKILSRLAAGCEIWLAVLREIFDESAYQRFLQQKELASSTGAYAEFCCSRDEMKIRRPRCC